MGTNLTDAYRDKAGRKRYATPLQQKIVRYRMDNIDVPLSQVARDLKCSYEAVKKADHNPVCSSFAAEIKAMVNKALVMPLEERQRVLSVIARTNITDVVGMDGAINLSKDNPACVAVSEYVTTKKIVESSEKTDTYIENSRIKLYSKLEAITILDKQDKIYSDAPQINIDKAVIITEVEVRLK